MWEGRGAKELRQGLRGYSALVEEETPEMIIFIFSLKNIQIRLTSPRSVSDMELMLASPPLSDAAGGGGGGGRRIGACGGAAALPRPRIWVGGGGGVKLSVGRGGGV